MPMAKLFINFKKFYCEGSKTILKEVRKSTMFNVYFYIFKICGH